MKQKHIPQRTCVGCRVVKAKRELVRIVREPSGNVELDTGGKKSGRGVYICPSISCLEAAIKGGRIKAGLEADIPEEVIGRIRERLQGV